jgi:hypothetical protein
MKAIERLPTAAMQVGSILLIKYEVSGKPLVQVRTLTQRELIQLEKNQDLLKSPADILERLSELCHRGSRSAKNVRQQNGIDPGRRRCLFVCPTRSPFAAASKSHRVLMKECRDWDYPMGQRIRVKAARSQSRSLAIYALVSPQ